METLQTIIQSISRVEKEILEEEARHQTKFTELKQELTKLNEARYLANKGLDLGKIAKGTEIVTISGKTSEDGHGALEFAIRCIANNNLYLRKMYCGVKRYDGFWQREDHEYGFGPAHGTIVFRVGLNDSYRKRDLSSEEIDAALYYMNNYKAIEDSKNAS